MPTLIMYANSADSLLAAIQGVRQVLSFESPVKGGKTMKPVKQPSKPDPQPAKPATQPVKPASLPPKQQTPPKPVAPRPITPPVEAAGGVNDSWLCCIRLASAKLSKLPQIPSSRIESSANYSLPKSVIGTFYYTVDSQLNFV